MVHSLPLCEKYSDSMPQPIIRKKESLFKSTFIYLHNFIKYNAQFLMENIWELVGECEPLKQVEEGRGMRRINNEMIDRVEEAGKEYHGTSRSMSKRSREI